VIVGAMVAVSFGSYATSLFIGADAGPAWDNVFTTLVVLGTLGINLVGSRIVDRTQTAIVVVELAVFAVFIAVTIADADWNLLAFSGYPAFSDIVASVALTFFAFLGFSVITFSAGDLADPAYGLPRAMYAALGIAAGLYILISFGVFGTLPVDDVVAYGETAIAEAARPALGDAGFVMMALAALLATTSSVNATLYASGGLTRMLAEVGQFPPVFGRRTARGAHVGLLITAALVAAIANLVDLSAIASVGSAIALAVFVLVALAGYRRRAEAGASPPIAIAAIGVAAVVLVFFAVDTLRNAPATFIAIVAIGVLAVALDAIWKRHAVDPSGSARGRAEALAQQPVAERAVAHDERRAAELGEDRSHDAGTGEDHRGSGQL
jgi:amino acid transporter